LRFQSMNLDHRVNHGIHILSVDETRKHFRPMLWDRCSHSNQVMEQIWVPGVHSDIGGGYQESFISTISLITMIDKIREYAPKIEFDEQYIKKNLLSIVEEQEPVINDEWSGNLIPDAEYRRTVNHSAHLKQTAHPLLGMMREISIKIRNSRLQYRPAFDVGENGHIPDTQFASSSWYNQEVIRILQRKFASMPP
jgi:hypothetical protein